MYVLVWYNVGHDVEDFQVLSYSEDEKQLHKVAELFSNVENIEGWRLKKEYLKAVSKDVGVSLPIGGYLDVLKVDVQKEIEETHLDEFLANVKSGVISEKILEDAEDSEFKQQQLTKKLKASFVKEVQWNLYDLGYPIARVSSVEERIEDMFENNQGDVDKSMRDVADYFERFGKQNKKVKI